MTEHDAENRPTPPELSLVHVAHVGCGELYEKEAVQIDKTVMGDMG